MLDLKRESGNHEYEALIYSKFQVGCALDLEKTTL